ncbi:MAG: ABC transporter substrate-binding protein [Acidimicrobiia bacterium]|nr:ABC transporter substrate-binding protein [Acidimicrobiia bacterium]
MIGGHAGTAAGRAAGLVVAATCVALIATGCSSASGSATPTLHWYIGKQSSPAFTDDAAACTKASGGRYRIKVEDLPADATAQREQLVRRLAARDSSIDLIGMDVVWTGEFAKAGWVKEWTGEDRAAVSDGNAPAAVATATFENRLWGAPQNTNAQVLFFRKDLVPQPPKTWDDMITMAERLPVDGRVEAQGAQYEGLVVWFASLVSSAGGSIIDNDKVTLGQPAVEALRIMKRLATSKAADPSLENAQEDQATTAFVAGKAAFMVNYSAVYPSLQKEAPQLVDKVAVAPWPSVRPDQPSKVTLGGYNLGVGNFTKHPAAAFSAAMCLRNDESQVRNAAEGGLPPTILSLYQDPRIKRALSQSDVLLGSISNATQRPVTPAYNDVSLVIQKTIHPESQINPQGTERSLRSKLNTVLHSGGLI